jgi:hypothetical protein
MVQIIASKTRRCCSINPKRSTSKFSGRGTLFSPIIPTLPFVKPLSFQRDYLLVGVTEPLTPPTAVENRYVWKAPSIEEIDMADRSVKTHVLELQTLPENCLRIAIKT